MIDLSSSCIFSGSTENLNTTMIVTVNDEKYKVAVSDEHEDDAAPSRIKKLVAEKSSERDAKFEKLKALAEELGIPLQALQQPTGDGLVVLQKLPEEDQSQVIESSPQSKGGLVRQKGPVPDISKMEKVGGFRVQKNTRSDANSEGGLTKAEAEAALEQAKRSSAGQYASPTDREAPRYAPLRIPNTVETKDSHGNIVRAERPDNIAQRRQVVKGRAGIPISIPKTITSRSGTDIIETTINIVESGGDQGLQRRFKDLNYSQQMSGNYVAECRPCRGTGIVGRKKDTCKQCGGRGVLS